MANAFVRIADHVFDGTTSRVTFKDIPQDYEELWMIWTLRTARAAADVDQVQFYVNGVQSNTTYGQIGGGFLSSGGSTTRTSNTFFNSGAGWYGQTCASDNMATSLFGNGIIKFWNYNKSDEYKQGTLFTSTINNSLNTANMYIQENGIHAQILDPIREINFKSLSGSNFKQYSSISLYGVG